MQSDIDMNVDDEVGLTVCHYKDQIGKSISFSKLKSTEMHMLPKSVAAAKFDDIHKLMDVCQSGLQSIVRTRRNALGVDYQSHSELREILDSQSFFESATSLCSSDHLLQKYCTEHTNLVSPVPIYVADNENTQLVGHYVPVLPSLVHYLQHSDVWASYQKCDAPGNVMRDYVDG